MDDERTPAEDAQPGLRLVQDADTLKALSDPLRLTMLRVMMPPGGSGVLRAWTVKELAAELGEPQTKLYRHIKQLEERGLLRVAGSRLVSGIVEQRYIAAQTGLQLSRDFLGSAAVSQTSVLLDAGMDSFRQEFAAGVRSGSIDLNAEPLPGISYRSPLMALADVRLRPERAAEFRDRMGELIEEYLGKADETPDPVPLAGSVTMNVMIALYGREHEQHEEHQGQQEQQDGGPEAADPAG